jgi:hypothetical protein
MKKYAAFAVLLGILVSYQNCAPQNGAWSGSPAELTTEVPSSYNQIPVQNFQTLSVWDAPRAQFLDVDLGSGKVAAFVDGGQTPGDHYCLTPELLSSLKSILAAAQVCVPVVDAKQLANQMCAQNYTYPYASLMGNGMTEYRLGEKRDSCEAPVDLCGNAADNLRAWASDFLSRLPALSCH